MDLKCYVFPGWEPRIRAATSKRGWMDAAPESFPYRCLPLMIANSHGWEILSACGFEAEWNGGPGIDDVAIRPDLGGRPGDLPVALFGQGTFSIHIQGLFRTPPGWNILVSGPPNCAKDGVAPLSGIIETDWSPYTFTMNWQLTRPGLIVRFEENEPIAHIFPIERSVIESVKPRFVPIDDDPALKANFETWSAARIASAAQGDDEAPLPSLYYRGLTTDGTCPIRDHQSALNVREFANADLIGQPHQPRSTAISTEASWKIAKYEWLFETMERQRSLSEAANGILRCKDLTSEEFLEEFYASGRPVILCGALEDWPARRKWTPEYLRERIGDTIIECQGGRTRNKLFEIEMEAHRQKMPFTRFMELITSVPGNEYYMTANNCAANVDALAPLQGDLGMLDNYLDHPGGTNGGLIWIGPEGSFTSLHHDLTNNLLAQLVGRKRVVLVSPAETPKLYNHLHVFSEIVDLAGPDIDLAAYPRLKDVRMFEVVLYPGEALFIPIGWWHQVTALDFSVSLTNTNFRWPNEGYRDHPVRG